MDKTADASNIWRETSDASGRGEGHPPMAQSLKERLLAKEHVTSEGQSHPRLINPDGPEAVREIERLEALVAELERHHGTTKE